MAIATETPRHRSQGLGSNVTPQISQPVVTVLRQSNAATALTRLVLYGISAIIFLALFSLSHEHAREGISEGITRNPKFYYRCLPLLASLPCLFAIDLRYCGFQALKMLVTFPGVLILWYLGISVGASFLSNQVLLGGWKAFEYGILLYWAAVATQFASQHGSATPLKQIYILSAATVCHIWLMAIVFPSLAFSGYSGYFVPALVCPYPDIVQNHVAYLSFTVFSLAVISDIFDRKVRPLRYAIIALALAALLLAHTRSIYLIFCLFACLVFCLCLFGGSSRVQSGKRALYCFTSGCIILVLAGVFASNQELLVKMVTRGQDATEMRGLSGRSTLWGVAVKEIKRNPLVGYGLSLGSRNLNTIREYRYVLARELRKWESGTMNIHSSVLESLLSAGFIGALPLLSIIFLWAPWRALRRLDQINESTIIAAMLAMTVVVRAIFVSNLALFSLDAMAFLTLMFAMAEPAEHHCADDFASESSLPEAA